MSDVALARDLLHEAFPRSRYGKWDAALYEAFRFLKPRVEARIPREYTLRRVRSIHEGTARRIDGAELDALKEAKLEEARREYRELQKRLKALETSLAMADAAVSGRPVAAYRPAENGVGGLDSAGIDGGRI